MEQKAKNCTEMAGAQPKPQFSVDERVFMVLKYTETGNVLQTIRKFQRQFPNQRTPCRKPVMGNYVTSKDSTNSGWYWYGKKGTGSSPLTKTQFQIIGTRSSTSTSTENCGLGSLHQPYDPVYMV